MRRDVNAEIISAANKRFDLMNSIKINFGDDAFQKVITMDDKTAKCEVLQSLYPNKKLIEQSESYIEALFDATIASRQNDKMMSQRKNMANTVLVDGLNDRNYSTSAELSTFQKRIGGK